MVEGQRWGILPPYRKASFPAFPGMIAVLGPGVIFMALAQGSSELIWWPFIIAKYRLTFLLLLLPTCLLQFPIIGFAGTVLFSLALIFLHHIIPPRHLPIEARPGRLGLFLLVVSCLAYIILAIAYLLSRAEVI